MTVELLLADYSNSKHRQDLVDLLNAYATDPMGGNEPISEFARENLCDELATRPHLFALLCYVEGQPAGFCICVEGFSTFKAKPNINIHDIAVAPEFRRMGLSHRLLEKVERIARDRGCCKLTLEVLKGNEVAQKSYRSFGFSGYELNPELGHALFWEKPL